MRTTRGAWMIGALLALSLTLTGCGGSGKAEEVPASSEPEAAVEPMGLTVGISLPNEESSIWIRDGEALAEGFAARGCETELRYSGNDAVTQAADVKSLISAGCDLLIIAPVDPASVGNALEAARAEAQAAADAAAEGSEEEAETVKLPSVLSLGSLITETDAVSCAVLADSYQAGVLQAEAVLAGLSMTSEDGRKSTEVEFTAGDPADPESGYIFNGMYDTLQPYLESGAVKVLSGEQTFAQASGAFGEGSQARLEEIFSEYYKKDTKLGAVLGGTDAEAAGAIRALSSSYGGKHSVMVCGSGADDEALKRIIDGDQTMTVFVPVCSEAMAAVDIGLSLMQDEVTDSYVIRQSSWSFGCRYDTTDYFNGRGIVPAFLIEPVAVTKDNYQSVLVDQGYYRMDGKYPKAVE